MHYPIFGRSHKFRKGLGIYMPSRRWKKDTASTRTLNFKTSGGYLSVGFVRISVEYS